MKFQFDPISLEVLLNSRPAFLFNEMNILLTSTCIKSSFRCCEHRKRFRDFSAEFWLMIAAHGRNQHVDRILSSMQLKINFLFHAMCWCFECFVYINHSISFHSPVFFCLCIRVYLHKKHRMLKIEQLCFHQHLYNIKLYYSWSRFPM